MVELFFYSWVSYLLRREVDNSWHPTQILIIVFMYSLVYLKCC